MIAAHRSLQLDEADLEYDLKALKNNQEKLLEESRDLEEDHPGRKMYDEKAAFIAGEIAATQ